jgi:DNA invertase Pin-like site-specific DNA recombinase
MIIGYIRSSPFEPANRREAKELRLTRVGAERIFCDRGMICGPRPELERAIACAERGDVIAIMKPYHIARTTRGVLALMEQLGNKGVGLRIINTPIDTSTTTGRMILGSAPLWSIGISPLQSIISDLLLFWRR